MTDLNSPVTHVYTRLSRMLKQHVRSRNFSELHKGKSKAIISLKWSTNIRCPCSTNTIKLTPKTQGDNPPPPPTGKCSQVGILENVKLLLICKKEWRLLNIGQTSNDARIITLKASVHSFKRFTSRLLKVSFVLSLCTYYLGWMSCFISFQRC